MKRSSIACVLSLVPTLAWAGHFGGPGQQVAVPFSTQTGPYGYHEYLPQDYVEDGTSRFALVVFLHGVGERGNGESQLGTVLNTGVPRMIADGRHFPALVLSPQSPTSTSNWEVARLDQLLDYALQFYPIDPDRVYVTGLSMGGGGTWRIAHTSPQKLAAIVPICGTRGSPPVSGSPALFGLPIWASHAWDDQVVPFANTPSILDGITPATTGILQGYPNAAPGQPAATHMIALYSRAQQLHAWQTGATSTDVDPDRLIRMVVYRDGDHYIWGRTYNDDNMWNWLFHQRRNAPLESKGDFDGDRQPDLVLQRASSGAVRVWYMNGAARRAEGSLTPAPASAQSQVVAADDFDADGKTDLVFRQAGGGAVEFWLLNGTARVGAPVPLSGASAPGPEWELGASGDFDHDGKPDLLWRNRQTQKLRVWTMNGAVKQGELLPSPDQAADANWSVVAALDYDRDGQRDLLWYNSTSGRIVFWRLDATLGRLSGNFTSPASAGSNNWKVVAGGDYGSGGALPALAPDIVWRNDTSGRLVVWHMNAQSSPLARVVGEFTTPAQPQDPLDQRVAGPR